MKRTLVGCLAVLIVLPSALAMWATIALEDLLKRTDVIVVARLTEVREKTKRRIDWGALRVKGTDYGSGTLVVTEVIHGGAKLGEKLRLEWSNDSKLACPRVEHAPYKGQTMIWLLEKSTNATVRADYPGRVLDLKKRGELDALLKKE